ncbi:MAG: T9SS type A sorting domain-containing protein [Taibaiella sp.]|nr:T9SS type A sorting domain-containing protein [Taibaiella sp.]
MKKMFTTLALLLLSAALLAQTEFAPLNATWTYRGGFGPLEEYADIYKNISEEMIEGKLVKTIKCTRYQQDLTYMQGTPYYTNRDTLTKEYKIYQSDDTVFVYNDLVQKYTPVYFFNVQAGDTIRIPVHHLPGGQTNFQLPTVNGDTSAAFVIDSVVQRNINGFSFKEYYFSDLVHYTTDWSNFNGIYDYPLYSWCTDIYGAYPPDSVNIQGAPYQVYRRSGAYNDLFGGLSTGLLPEYYFLNVAQYGTIADYYLPFVKFCSYEDDSGSWAIGNNCGQLLVNTPLSLKNQTALAAGIEVFPNPSSDGYFHIRFEKPFAPGAKLWITDLLGKVIFSNDKIANKTETGINLSGFNKGMYLLVFEIGGQPYYHKLIIGK